MQDIFSYFDHLNEDKLLKKDIKVYGWQFSYDYTLESSIIPYLFEELKIHENIAKESNNNRDLRIKDKKYITIHDTGDTLSSHTALFWSNTVYNEHLMDTKAPYAASFQYVVGNDGIYHNIPDNEVAYHAGDSTAVDYNLYKTDIPLSNKYIVTIENGNYYINGIDSKLPAPKKIIDNIEYNASTNDINDMGILVKEVDGKVAIGETYYNKTYHLIANRGGNNNSIGIEVAINEGTNIYYTYLLTAKLVAKLLMDNNLTFDDIKQHHYFSGKNCPQTLRRADLWNYFIQLVKIAYDMLTFEKQGYQIKFMPLCSTIDENGFIKTEEKTVNNVKYKITVIYQNKQFDKVYFKRVE